MSNESSQLPSELSAVAGVGRLSLLDSPRGQIIRGLVLLRKIDIA
jgi:hypothetical protein